jgi:hypothetical protein
MKKIIYLNILLFVHGISAMDAVSDQSEIRHAYMIELCGFSRQMPSWRESIIAVIDRLTDEGDAEAVEAAKMLIYSLEGDLNKLSERKALEMADEEMARAAQKEEDERGVQRRYGGVPGIALNPQAKEYVGGLDVTPLATDQTMSQFLEVCHREGLDFDVHKLDGFVETALPVIQRYLDDYSAITGEVKGVFGEDLSNLSVMSEDFRKIIENMSPDICLEHDLTLDHLDRAFKVLQQGQHATLVPMAVQIYMLIIGYAPNWKDQYVNLFLSNVNKFKGAECFEGYRNRFVAILLQFVRDYGMGTGQYWEF